MLIATMLIPHYIKDLSELRHEKVIEDIRIGKEKQISQSFWGGQKI